MPTINTSRRMIEIYMPEVFPFMNEKIKETEDQRYFIGNDTHIP